MTILTIPKARFEKEIGKLDEKMLDRIAMFGTPVEALTDSELQIEIFPNRPDLLSYQNYKMAISAFLGKSKGIKKIKLNPLSKNYRVIVEKAVSDVRPYTACAVIKGIKFNDKKIKEIIDIQEKLHLTLGRKRKKAAIGIYPLDKISFPIKFTAMAPEEIKFQPLEFPSEINGKQILSKHPAGREYGELLKGLEKYPVFIDSNKEILSMPPIINSHKTGKIAEDTKDLFIECSGFEIENLSKILNILVCTLHSMGGEIYPVEIAYAKNPIKTPDLTHQKIKICAEKSNSLLGLNLKEKDITTLLEKMGHEISGKNVLIAPWRTDIMHEVDLIEDIAIAYGYENFIPEMPKIATIGEQDKKESIKSKIAGLLVGLGLLETSSYHLTTKEAQIKNMGEKDFIKVIESKTEYNLLRKDLSHCLLRILSENKDVEYPQEIFEIGRVFKNAGESIIEKDSLAIALAPGNFTKMKQIFEYISRMTNVQIVLENPSLIPVHLIEGRTAEIKLGKQTIGFIGEVHPRILSNFKIKMPVSLLEIELDELMKMIVE
ncbi:phenylalanine--tRNA ligase subunit beta [Candidatus Pacearchaeota archaeon]|nr:phenylalanine--tRNA ligase subunit beta [Candidatus Pacearchaeota archaeon]